MAFFHINVGKLTPKKSTILYFDEARDDKEAMASA